ncbi:MAG TPA: SDR family oxidoreductase [Chryseosolibacter sp.]
MPKPIISILGCGWLGKSLGQHLANAGYVVNGSTTSNEKVEALTAAGITPFVFRVEDTSLPIKVQPFFDAGVLVISLPHGGRAGKVEDYLRQIRHVITAAHQGKVANIILISTTSVYPNLNRLVVERDADNDNPIVKAEQVVRDSGIASTVLRFAGLIGPGRHPGRFLAGKQNIRGGNVPVNLIHLDDCIRIIQRVIEQNVWNATLNACASEHPTRSAFYTKAALDLNLPPPVFAEDDHSDFKIVSNQELLTRLDYTFIRPLAI